MCLTVFPLFSAAILDRRFCNPIQRNELKKWLTKFEENLNKNWRRESAAFENSEKSLKCHQSKIFQIWEKCHLEFLLGLCGLGFIKIDQKIVNIKGLDTHTLAHTQTDAQIEIVLGQHIQPWYDWIWKMVTLSWPKFWSDYLDNWSGVLWLYFSFVCHPLFSTDWSRIDAYLVHFSQSDCQTMVIVSLI